MSIISRSFYFMRHGQTDWNASGRIMGQQEVPLNALGIQQAQAARAKVDELEITKVFYSPLLRAQQTMEIVTANKQCPKIACPEIMERCWGSWEGKLKKELGLPTHTSSMMLRPETPQGAESREEFFVRVLGGMREALSQPGPVLIIAHSGVYRVLCKTIGLDEDTVSIGNAQVVFFQAPSTATHNFWDITFI